MNGQQALLVKLARFLARRVPGKFWAVVLKRLVSPGTKRAPCSLTQIKRNVLGKEGKIVVVVGDVLADRRINEVPKMRVAALRFSETARAAILKAGGECMTLDQLALVAPKGTNTLLLRGSAFRKVQRHYGAPGVPGSHAAPKLGNRKANLRGRKHERARGRRNSKAWKVRA
eukprot:NODE_6262_length_648_cov_230.752399_g6239_i0.p2 GENE.NODE_6262_length_648_cov_230.752399_g6239_i0~~NODE_6262_length_648_cov_230.752399_g6239_i0.p2  ORF type:complete len:188 (-),score=44.31 NODE_6262_length_648_cov_230.752399_g6239_i0:83-598(-)